MTTDNRKPTSDERTITVRVSDKVTAWLLAPYAWEMHDGDLARTLAEAFWCADRYGWPEPWGEGMSEHSFPLRPVTDFAVGDPVLVHAMGQLYRGTVHRITRTRITAEYTSGAGVTRTVTAAPDKPYSASMRDGSTFSGPRIILASGG